MREIRFRGKSIGGNNEGKWVNGVLIPFNMEKYPYAIVPDGSIYMEVEDEETAYPMFTGDVDFVDPSTVGQYTGFKDIDGKEIWEGDIVWYDGDKCLIALNDYCGWVINEEECFEDINWSRIQVIGNRWDNPELMGGQE